TILPTLTLCPEELPYEWTEQPNTPIIAPGTYNLTSIAYDNYIGCDSFVRQRIIVRQPVINNIGPKYICEGECFEINNNQYCDAGVFEEKFKAWTNCDSTVRFTVVKIPVNAVIAAHDTLSCANPSLTLSSTGSISGGGTMYSWTNAAGTSIGTGTTVTVNSVGLYKLIVSSTVGGKTCRDTAQTTVSANGIVPSATAVGGTLNCFQSGLTVTLQGGANLPGMVYSWAGPGITPANMNFQNPTVNQTGTYTVTVTNPNNGCSSTASASVNSDLLAPAPLLKARDTLTCARTAITLDLNYATNVSPVTYNWSGPGITPANQNIEEPTVSVLGTYTVTVTNPANGCTGSATTFLSENFAAPAVSAGADQVISCLQTSVTLNGTASGSNVLWTGPGINVGNQNLLNPTISNDGVYVITATRISNGCTKTDTVVVKSVVDYPNVEAGSGPTITCANPTAILDGLASSQGPNFTATWTGPGITPANANQYAPTVGAWGSYTLTILNTTNGCTATDEVTVINNTAPPVAMAGPDLVLTCATASGVILVGNGFPASVTYLWSGPGIGVNNATMQKPTVTVAGTYCLTVTNPANGCEKTDCAAVTQDASLPTAFAGNDQSLNCTVNSVNISSLGSSVGPGIKYDWTGPGGFTSTQPNLTNITTPGNYTLVVTNTNSNCQNTDVVAVYIDTLRPVISAGPDFALTCKNGKQVAIAATATSTGNNFTVTWTGPDITPANANQLTPTITLPGTYTLTVRNQDSQCSSTDVVQVIVNDVHPPVDAGPDQTLDCVTNSIALGNPNSPTDYFFEWQGPGITPLTQNEATPLVSEPGRYSVVVTDIINGCTSTDSTLIEFDVVLPNADAGTPDTLTCAEPILTIGGQGTDISPDVAIIWTGPDINSNNESLPFPEITLPGTYILSVFNFNNKCETLDTVVIASTQVPPVCSAGPDVNFNCASSIVRLDASQSATGPDIGYAWAGPGISPLTENEQSPDVDAPGFYILTVTDLLTGCQASDEVFVGEDVVAPFADAGPDILLTCGQNLLPLDGTNSNSNTGAAVSYTWIGPGINTLNVDLPAPTVGDSGTYVLIVTDLQNQCTATDTAYVALDGKFPIADAGPVQVITCAVDTVTLDASLSQSGPDISYAWSGPGIVAGQENLQNPQAIVPGVYELTVTDAANGCSKTALTTIELNVASPMAEANDDLLLTCTTNAVTLSSNGSTSGANIQYTWQGPGIDASNQNEPGPTVTVAGNYALVVTDLDNGCTDTDGMVVEADQNLPTANAGVDKVITCSTSSVLLEGTGNWPVGAQVEFEWSGPGITPASQNLQQPEVTVPGVYALSLTNIQSNCTATDVVIVTEDLASPGVVLTADTLTCAVPQTTLVAECDRPDSKFFWQGPGILPGTINLQNPPITEPGLYQVTVTGPNGCTTARNIVVEQQAELPVVTAEGALLNCYNDGQAILGGSVVSPPNTTSNWNGPNGFTSADLMPIVTQPGFYTLVVEAAGGCRKEVTVEVRSDFSVPVAQAFTDDKIDCNTSLVTLNGGGSSVSPIHTYNWSGGSIVSGGNTLYPTVDSAGLYTLTVLNVVSGCTDTANVQIEIDENRPSAFVMELEPIRCFGDDDGEILVNQVIGGTGPYVFSLNGGIATSTEGHFVLLTAGEYTIEVEDANGCIIDTTVILDYPDQLQVDLGTDLELLLGDSTTLEARWLGSAPIASVVWNPAAPCDTTCLEFGIRPLSTVKYNVTVIDTNGCKASDDILVLVKKERDIYVANAIDGESDSENGLLMLQTRGNLVKNVRSFLIFDRWGEAVFEVHDFQPNDPDFGWDGTIRSGKEAPPGVYVWYAVVEFVDGEIETLKGDVAVVKL
ncbi:MAG: gliding motility-associated C-terminal domain-containing protein, partial [Saprospiraceae bacterium]